MPQPSPWSIKGIGPDARRLAKKAAQKEGVTLGAWLTQKIAEASEGGPTQLASAVVQPTPAPRPESALVIGESGAELKSLMTELTELLRAERSRPAPIQTVAAPDPRLEQITRSLEGLADARLETARRLDSLDETTRRIDDVLVETVDAIDSTRRQTATAVRAAALLAERVAALDPELGDADTPTDRKLASQAALKALAERLGKRCDDTEAALAALAARLGQSSQESASPSQPAFSSPEHDASTPPAPEARPSFEETYHAVDAWDAAAATEAPSDLTDPEQAASEHAAPEHADADDHWDGQAYAHEDLQAYELAQQAEFGVEPLHESREAHPAAPSDDPWSNAFGAGQPAGDVSDAPAEQAAAASTSSDPWAQAFGGENAPSETGEAEFLPDAAPQVEIKPLGVAALRDRLRADLEQEAAGELSLSASLQKIRNLLPKSQPAHASPAEAAAGLAQEIRALDEMLKRGPDAALDDDAHHGDAADRDDDDPDDVDGPGGYAMESGQDAPDLTEEDPIERSRRETGHEPVSLTESLTRALAAESRHGRTPDDESVVEQMAWLVGGALRNAESESELDQTRHALPSWLKRRGDATDDRAEKPMLELREVSRVPSEDDAEPGEDYDGDHDGNLGAETTSGAGRHGHDRFERSRVAESANERPARPWDGFQDGGLRDDAGDGPWNPAWRPTDRESRLTAEDRYWVETSADGVATERGGMLPFALFSATIGAAIVLAYGATL